MGRACSIHGEGHCIQGFGGKANGNDHQDDLDIGVRILKQKTEWGATDGINLAEYRDQGKVLVNMEMKLWIPHVGEFLSS
jgi:hypothetical protein